MRRPSAFGLRASAFSLQPSAVGVLAVLGIIVAGGLTGASPAICPLPSAFGTWGRALALHSATPALRHLSTSQTSLSREDVDHAIDRLGAFDDDERMRAAGVVRRAPGTVALPALVDAAAGHADSFVRYRALVLLSGYDDPRVPDQMELALGEVNDRLRSVAFAYFERHPEPRLIPVFLKAFDKEVAEFVRPALIRALAAQGSDTRVRAPLIKDVTRGEEFFRSSAIDALGDYKAAYALKVLSDVAAVDGPLRDHAVMAVGKIGDTMSVGLLTGLQQTAQAGAQPTVAAALCLLGSDCDAHRGFLVRTLALTDRDPGFQELLRAAASGLSALAVNGDVEAGRALFETGVRAVDPARAPVALALARLAVTQPAALVALVEQRQDRDRSLELLRDGFDMLDEDFNEEQFFVALRKAYFAETEGSARRTVIQSIINMLEF